MPPASSDCLRDQLAALRTKLAGQAFALERQGRLGELCDAKRPVAGA